MREYIIHTDSGSVSVLMSGDREMLELAKVVKDVDYVERVETIRTTVLPARDRRDSIPLRQAAQELLDVCMVDFGDGADDDDTSAVASGDRGDSAVQFGHMRRLRQALLVETPASEPESPSVYDPRHPANMRSQLSVSCVLSSQTQDPVVEILLGDLVGHRTAMGLVLRMQSLLSSALAEAAGNIAEFGAVTRPEDR